MPPITSPQNSAVKLIRSLADKKHRQETGLFVAEGKKVLARARAESWQPVILAGIEPPAAWGDAERLHVSERVMAAVSGQRNPTPLIGVFRQSWISAPDPAGVWVALEAMRDPGNLGTIIRTCDAVGASGVVLVGPCCDPFSPEAVRASMGSIFGVRLVRMDADAFAGLAESWPGDVAGFQMQGAEDYRRNYRSPTLLVMGSEGTGLSDMLARSCNALIRIPMPGAAESLNVAIATALALYEVRRGDF
jgi:TrmH family RNA methyltransferase